LFSGLSDRRTGYMMSEKKMIKIVRVISRLNVGGPAIHTVLLSEALNKGGYKDILVCGRVSEAEGDMSNLAASRNVKPVIVKELKRDITFKGDLKAFLELYRIMRRERPDIVHTHAAKAGTLGRMAAILSGVPVRIHTFHGHIFDGYFNPVKAKIFLLIERFLALFTDKVVTVSDVVRDEISNKLKVTNSGKCVVVQLGLELDKFLVCEANKGIFRKDLGLDGDTILVGIIGRLVPIKNHKMFLDAAKIVLEKCGGRKIKFIVIGDGELRMSLEKHAKDIGIKDHVIFTGWRKRLSSVYADLDIVALTSLNEGTPVSIIEAMASGKAVVATAVGGVGDLVRDGINGALAGSDDAHDFAGKLLDLVKDKDKRSSYGLEGRDTVRERYSKDRLVKDIKRLYDECLKEKLKR
jgi:glycosyltransferase involved in cell wall biosynthesis